MFFICFRPLDGIQLRPLNWDSDIEKVNSVSPHKQPGSLHFYRRQAQYNVNIGAYKDDGTLVSWLLR